MEKYESRKALKNKEDSYRNREYDNGHEILAIIMVEF